MVTTPYAEKPKNENPNYHMGQRTGYTLINGEYHIAPAYVEQFAKLNHKKRGISEMLEMVNRHAAQDLEQISIAEKRLWDSITEDIGLERDVAWTYHNGIIWKPESNIPDDKAEK